MAVSFKLTIEGAAGGSYGVLEDTIVIDNDDDGDLILGYIMAEYGAEGVTPHEATKNYSTFLMDQLRERASKWAKAQARALAERAVSKIPYRRAK